MHLYRVYHDLDGDEGDDPLHRQQSRENITDTRKQLDSRYGVDY